MGDQSHCRGRGNPTSGGSREMAERRRGEAQEKEVVFNFQGEKKEEKEKEGQEGRYNRGEPCRGSRHQEGEGWEQGSCQKDPRVVLWEHRPRSQPKGETPHCQKGQEGGEEGAGQQHIDDVFYQQRGVEWRRGKSPGRPEQSAPASGTSPWSSDRQQCAEHESVPDSDLWIGMGARSSRCPAASQSLQPSLHLGKAQRRDAARIPHSLPLRRSTSSRTVGRIAGRDGSTIKEFGAGGSGHSLANSAETRAGTSQRSSDKYQARTPACPQGGQARPGCQAVFISKCPREGQRQREEQVPGKGQGQGQRQRGRSQESGLILHGCGRGGESSGDYELPGEGGFQKDLEVVRTRRKKLKWPLARSGPGTKPSPQDENHAKGGSSRSRRTPKRSTTRKLADGARCGKVIKRVAKGWTRPARRIGLHTRALSRQDEQGKKRWDADVFPGVAATTAGLFSPQATPRGAAEVRADSSGMCRGLDAKSVAVSAGNWESLRGIIDWLEGRTDDFFGRLCKTKPTGRVFPLPSSPLLFSRLFPHSSPGARSLLRCLVFSLNSLNGEGNGDDVASDFQKELLAGLLDDCVRVEGWRMTGEAPSWDDFFRVKGVDYKGDEVLTAQMMQWENVQSALPNEVGGVPLEDVVEKGCKHYVLNFEDYLLAEEDQTAVRPPRVMVPPDAWESFCQNLLARGVFSKVHEDDVYRVKDQMLLNGLFGVSKNEFDGPWEVHRIIMNLIPLNAVCRGMEGDVSTLPSWAGMSPLSLEPGEELVISSEDVRCFFYIFKVPSSWHRFLAFNRPLPERLAGDKPGRWFPCSAVLPMGFKNSVALAQHVHRFIVQGALRSVGAQGAEAELRKDRPYPTSNPVHRIYLDNFDQLMKVAEEDAKGIQGSVTPLVQALREEYSALGVPRHPKKSVASQAQAEVQGAIVDGKIGLAYPKVDKVLKYAHLSRLLLEAGEASQKQMQIVGGGLVYMSMFRRPLLGGLNQIWRFIVQCEHYPPFVKFPLSPEVKEEIARFLGLIPLAYMDFRTTISPLVTASDASQSGGGVTVSTGLTPAGVVASKCTLRGDVVEPADIPSVLTIGLFDGIGALRVAVDALGWNVAGHISVEQFEPAQRVVESRFPNSLLVHDVALVDLEMVRSWAEKFSQVALVLLGGGPPCQGVSGLNAARKGALKDARSCLFSHVPRIRELVRKAFPWAQIQTMMENVASMDLADQTVMSESFGEEPWLIDAASVSLAHRPRLYWLEWELVESEHVKFGETPSGRRSVQLMADVEGEDFLTPGWKLNSSSALPTFTTSRPREKPGYKPAGLQQCTKEDIERWQDDQFRFPPYQYQAKYLLRSAKGGLRLPNVQEREVIMGFPKDFTLHCLPKKDQGSFHHNDVRMSLIGNSWNVTVVSWLLSQLGARLGLNPSLSPQEVVQRTTPGCTKDLQTFLNRPSMKTSRRGGGCTGQLELVKKLLTLVSIKGEDILIQAASEDLTRYHRLRASIPAKLWRWKAVASWRWTGSAEHINALEIRAVLTALRWRLERHKISRSKFVHMVDSLVALHCLSRGRSSSKKLRRTVLRINALLLATRSHAVWTYVHTKLNPADAPSRRPLKRKWQGCQRGI